MNKPITNLIKQLKKQYPDGKHWRPEFIYRAMQRRLSQDVARSLSDMIDEYLEYNSDRTNYMGVYEDLFKVIGGEDIRNFIINYSLKAGITESENEAHRFVDHLLAAEEILEANTPLEGTLAHYEIEQEQSPQEVETGIDQFGEDTVLEIEAEGNPNEEETQLSQH